MRIAFQMDHPKTLNIKGDSTIALMQEAIKRGAGCYYYHPQALSFKDGALYAHAQPMILQLNTMPWYQLGEPELLPLASCDYVLIRQDPPFDMHYITATYLLEQLPDSVRVLNNPKGIRNAPEKLSVLAFPEFIPPTIISEDALVIEDFVHTHARVVAKPLYGFGGHGVFQFAKGDANIETFLEHWQGIKGGALVWQAFLPEVKASECRILMIDGAVKAAFARIPAEGSIRSNMRVGGTPVKVNLSDAQLHCMQAIAPMLKAQGLHLAGVDMIGPYLMEINVTSPTGLRAVEHLYQQNLAADFWDTAGLYA